MSAQRSLLMRLTRRFRRWRLVEALAVHLAVGGVKVVAALPSRWILVAGDFVGNLLSVLDRRGYHAAHQNMEIAFGGALDRHERQRIHRRAYRQVVRSMFLLVHLQPLDARRYRRWVDVPDVREAWQTRLIEAKGGVLVSGHIGNWELMLGLRVMFPDMPPTAFLAEAIPHSALNRILKGLRSHGDLIGAFRKGGARAVISNVAAGGTAALLVDRNVRGAHGGVYAPFMGLPARTTPLPAWISLRYGVPLFPMLCLPTEAGRYRLWLGPNLAEDLPEGTEQEQVLELLTRMNAVFEDVIRARPELWNWTLKRWKSRPSQELDGYPAYSLWDPER
jgi:KDO2-lipid IV(A) lauroyltransferase